MNNGLKNSAKYNLSFSNFDHIMRVLLLADTNSEHIEKWALSLAAQGIELGLFSFNRSSYQWYNNVANITLLFEPDAAIKGFGLQEKLGYFKYLPILKSKIKEFNPDILHAHYATSYGLIGALSQFKPFIVSVWGSDVFDFPHQGIFNKYILKYILHKASAICSTSICMKDVTHTYTNKPIEVIPFGINTTLFNRKDNELPLKNINQIVIGNIKPLESKYGIDILIKVVNQLIKKHATKNISLILIGEGSEKNKYEVLARDLGISQNVNFAGRVPHKEIADYHNKIDLFVSLSVLDSESFGVSLVEAMSCRSVVVGSNVAGFNEVLGGNNEVGYLVPKNSVEEAVSVLNKIIDNPEEALSKVNLARTRVLKLYNWDSNVEQMISVYQKSKGAK